MKTCGQCGQLIEFEGFSTYETFLVANWLTSNKTRLRYWQRASEVAQTEVRRHFPNGAGLEIAKQALAQQLEAELKGEASVPELQGVWRELYECAWADISWRQLAELITDSTAN